MPILIRGLVGSGISQIMMIEHNDEVRDGAIFVLAAILNDRYFRHSRLVPRLSVIRICGRVPGSGINFEAG